MARANPQSLPGDRASGNQDWQSLRGELVALLDQVESQVARNSPPQQYDANERMRDLRMQMEQVAEPAGRHREALRSVQRAVDRFSDHRDEPMPSLQTSPNPRDTLQSAIDQIRSRPAAPQQRVDVARLDDFVGAMGSMTARLERIESGLKQGLGANGDVKAIADQVAQLSHVVELLAGAVGETGQVKRLEGQIAALGKIVAQTREADVSGREADMTGLTRRLDDMSTAVGRLADLQVQFANRVDNPAQTNALREGVQAQNTALRESLQDQGTALREGMHAIERSLRSVYDRIDTLERGGSVPGTTIDQLTGELSRFTEVMKTSTSPQSLVELIDALNQRIGDLETGDTLLHALRKDLSAMRDAVMVALEPRFDAIERRIAELAPAAQDFSQVSEALAELNARIGERPIDPGIGQIEVQVRQLVARMDQTSDQLSGLAKLYASNEPLLPDLDALAERIAARTSTSGPDLDALAHRIAARTPAPLPQSALDALELRITNLLRDMGGETTPDADDFLEMRHGIEEVNERLRNLEVTLTARAEAPMAERSAPIPPMAKPPVPDFTDYVEPEAAPRFADLPPTTPYDMPMRMRPATDGMPSSPADDAPLTPEAYDDPNPNGRHRHPGLDADLSMASRYEQPPAPKPSIYEEPEAHEPQMAPVDLGPFAPPDHDDVPMPVSSNVPASSRNTFIEAARRAAQKQPAAARPVADSNSLIGRALARFQTSGAAATPEAAPRALAGDKPSRTEWKPEPPPIPVGADAPVAVNVTSNDLHAEPHEDHEDHKPSFLVRNRRLLLLAAILGAFGLLTFNLLMHRASSDPAPLNPGEDLVTNSIVEAGTLDPVPLQDMPVEIGGPRVIEMVDSLKTGSIDPSAAQGFAATPQAVPPALVAANALATDDTTAIAPLADPSAPPKTFELPPEGLGPIELRQAAGNGDPRAQFEIAAIYTEGRSVRQDYAAAATWYERAANQGFAPAQYRLGSLYEGGEGVDKDLNLARLWYERAAASGNRMSMHNLAALYAGGGLGKQEFDQAAKWFELAADHGLTDSQFNLGMLYARGLGVTQSLEQSFKWFGIAALSGDKDAAKARDDIARSLDADSMSRLTAEVAAFRAQSIDLKANFAPIGTWNAGFDPGETITAKDLVASVQGALSRLGYDIGVPDGVFGPKTAEAIKAFERGTGMSESGLINPRLLAVLGSQPV